MFRKFSRFLLAVALLPIVSISGIQIANAAATDAPIIAGVLQGTSGQLVVQMAPNVEATQNTWFYQVINNDAGCANPYGNSSTLNTSGAPSTITLSGLTDGCRYQINVANWNGETSAYTTTYAIPGVAKTSGACTTYTTSASSTYLNISAVGTNECLISITTTGQNVQWIPNYGLSSIKYLAVGGGGAGSRGECSVFWGAGGGGGEVLSSTSYSISSNTSTATSLFLYVGSGGAGSSSQACPQLTTGSAYTTPSGAATTIGVTAGGSTIANARGGSGITVNPVVNNNQGGKGGNSGNPSFTGYQYAYSNDNCVATACAAGGGGGAGASANGLNGGAGVSSDITGSTVEYGGGGAGKNNTTFGTATGGGCAGCSTNGGNATANRGGGGSDTSPAAGYVGGGSGVIYIRYTNSSLKPVFDKPVKTSTGFTINVVNYDSNYTWNTPTVSTGSVAITSTSGNYRKLTVSGLTAGQSTSLSVSTSKSGYADGTATASVTSLSSQSALVITSTSATFGSALTLTTSGGSGTGAITYSVTSSGSAGCSVSGTTLSFTAGGTCTVTATKAADVNYDSATSSATTITVSIVVTYNSQGGSSISSGTTTVGGSISTSPGSPTKNGYSFAGWFTASSGGTAITFPYIHGQSSSFTLYAQWTSCGSAVVQTSLLMHLDAANSCSTTGSTTAWNDISTNGNNATLLNSPTYEGTLRGKYYSFSNTSVATNLTTGKYATLPSGFSDFTSGISISFFAKFNSSSTSNETIFSLGSSAGTVNDEITLYRSGSSEQMSLYFKDYGTSGGWCYSNNFITSGVFAHYVVVWSPTNGCSFYRNGVLKGSAAFSLTPLVVTRSVAYLGRSVEHSSGMTYLNALMGDFAVYNSELSAADVVTNMQAQADAIYTVTYDMNGKTGTAPTDSKKYLTDSVVTISGSTPTTSGFSFQGWTLNAANTGTVYAANGTYTLAGANITFYAKWISNNLTTPSAPTASATSNTLKSITVSWSAISNSSSYTLKLYDSAGSSLLATVTGLTLLSRVITAADYASIADSTSYKVTVTAIGDGVSYSNSTESTKTAVTTNAAPVNPVISLQPVNASVASGGSATFSVTASVADAGTLTYQWQVSTNSGSTWNNVSSGTGGTTNSYSTGTVTYSSNSYQYKVIVANTKNGSTATTTSNAATLTITAGSTSISISLPNGATSASYQSAITITATSSVNGNVNFKLAGTTISGCGSVATTSLTATCSWTPTATGSNALTAVLTPSDTNNFSTSTSATVTVTVGTAVTTTSITIDLGQPEFLVTKNLTATVSVAGTVQFLADGKTIPGCFARPTNGSLQAVCAWRPAVRTSVTIVATLTPTDTSYAISTSAPTTAVVKPRSGARS